MKSETPKQYADRDIMAMGEYYARHVVAMTAEGLHDKADIAAELAYRDMRLAELERDLAEAREQLHLDEEENICCRGCGARLVCSNADCNNHAAVSVLEDEEELNRRIAEAVAKERERCVKAVNDESDEFGDLEDAKLNIVTRIRREAGEGENE